MKRPLDMTAAENADLYDRLVEFPDDADDDPWLDPEWQSNPWLWVDPQSAEGADR